MIASSVLIRVVTCKTNDCLKQEHSKNCRRINRTFWNTFRLPPARLPHHPRSPPTRALARAEFSPATLPLVVQGRLLHFIATGHPADANFRRSGRESRSGQEAPFVSRSGGAPALIGGWSEAGFSRNWTDARIRNSGAASARNTAPGRFRLLLRWRLGLLKLAAGWFCSVRVRMQMGRFMAGRCAGFARGPCLARR